MKYSPYMFYTVAMILFLCILLILLSKYFVIIDPVLQNILILSLAFIGFILQILYITDIIGTTC